MDIFFPNKNEQWVRYMQKCQYSNYNSVDLECFPSHRDCTGESFFEVIL